MMTRIKRPYTNLWLHTRIGQVPEMTVAWQAPMLLAMPLVFAYVLKGVNEDPTKKPLEEFPLDLSFIRW